MVGRAAALLLAVAAAPAAYALECGNPAIPPELIELNILGGRNAVPGSWPWHVGLYQKPILNFPPYDYGSHFCAGALIDEQTVVTAAHCLAMRKDSLRIHLGSHQRGTKDDDEQFVNVDHFCSHPLWRTGNTNDIGIIRLERPVQFAKTISPVCLPPQGDEVREGQDTLYVTGWGYTSGGFNRKPAEVLKQARQTFLDKISCRRMREMDVSKVICAKHDEGSSCHGDSGGPLVLQRNGIWQLQGVVSGGPPICGTPDWPMYYTEVAQYLDWINQYKASSDPLNAVGICKEGRR